jgi:hypothetical protein
MVGAETDVSGIFGGERGQVVLAVRSSSFNGSDPEGISVLLGTTASDDCCESGTADCVNSSWLTSDLFSSLLLK